MYTPWLLNGCKDTDIYMWGQASLERHLYAAVQLILADGVDGSTNASD